VKRVKQAIGTRMGTIMYEPVVFCICTPLQNMHHNSLHRTHVPPLCIVSRM